MPPERPARLTVRSAGDGLAYVYVDGLLVGDVLSGYASWTARLLAEGGNLHGGYAGQADGRRLKDVRAKLRRRLAENGPWWAAPAGMREDSPRDR